MQSQTAEDCKTIKLRRANSYDQAVSSKYILNIRF